MVKLSVISTVLHPDERLAQSIRSVRPRDHTEHIISVAGSLDRTREIVADVGPRSPILISAPGVSISDGFNLCLQRATGDLIWVLNSGDREIDIGPLVDELEKNPELDFAYGNVFVGETINRARVSPLTRRSCLLHGMSFCHGAVVVRKSFHEKFGQYDASYKLCMDAELFVKAILNGAKMVHVDVPVAYIEPGGISSNANKRISELFRIMSIHYRAPLPLLSALKWFLASKLIQAKKLVQ